MIAIIATTATDTPAAIGPAALEDSPLTSTTSGTLGVTVTAVIVVVALFC